MIRTSPIDLTKHVDLGSVNGKTVLITGGANSDGIGFGVAEAMAQNGAIVVIADINAEMGKKREAELTSKGYKAYFIHADVTDWDSLQAAFKFSIKHSPTSSLDIVFPSAGVMGSPTLSCSFPPDLDPDADLPEPASGKVIDINFKAVYNTTVLALHYFAKSAAGVTNGHRPKTKPVKQLLFISSLAGYVPSSKSPFGDYFAAKYGVRGLWRTIRFIDTTALPFDLRSNSICPTWVRTPLLGDAFAAYLEKNGHAICEVSEVVEVVMRVACDDEVAGRAVCVVPGGKSFDLEDDPRGADAGKVLYEKMKEEVCGPGVNQAYSLDQWFP